MAEEAKKEFDLRTHIRDPKTSQIIKVQPYSLRCEKGMPQIFIRDGIEYYGDGSLVHPEKKEHLEKRVK